MKGWHMVQEIEGNPVPEEGALSQADNVAESVEQTISSREQTEQSTNVPPQSEQLTKPNEQVRQANNPSDPVTMKSLLEAGVHFGHQTRRWNPRMKPFIFTHRNGIHIIDLQQTLFRLEQACKWVTDMVANGGRILFVGTKKQAQSTIETEANRCGMMYVTQRWLGGTLTNFVTIRSRINHMIELRDKRDRGYFQQLSKKEGLGLQDKLARLEKYFRGVENLDSLPGALFVIDLQKERLCVAEALKTGVPVVAVVDTDCDPQSVTVPIPANDDAIRSIKLVVSRIADAVLEGLNQREARMLEQESTIETDNETVPEQVQEDDLLVTSVANAEDQDKGTV